MKNFLDHKKWMDMQEKRMSSGGILLKNSAGELLIIKNNYKDYWSLPGGMVDDGETPRQAAIREVSEEVGVTLNTDQIEFVSVTDRVSDEAHSYQFIFKSLIPVDPNSIVLQEDEIDEYIFVTREQILSGDRHYGKVLHAWANNQTGYMEQTFGRD